MPSVFNVQKGGPEADQGIAAAVAALRAGHLVILPTDTVYGVAAHPDVAGAIERIFAAKGREKNKPLPLLAADAACVRAFGAVIGDEEARLIDRFWPGPLTLILAVGTGTEGFRVPDCDPARRLLQAAGGVLRVTSANRSGEPPALTARQAMAAIGHHVAVNINGFRSGTPPAVLKFNRSVRCIEDARHMDACQRGIRVQLHPPGKTIGRQRLQEPRAEIRAPKGHCNRVEFWY